MTDAFDDLERRLVAALPQPAAQRATSARRRPARRVLALGGVLVLGAAAAATAALTDNGTVVAPRSADVDLRPAFGVFRRPATEQDQIRTRDGRPDPTIAGESRLVLSDGSSRLYAQDASDGRVCLLFQSAETAAHACTAKDQAIAGDLPPSLTLLAPSGHSTTYLLLPDGVPSVATQTAGGRQETVPVTQNGVALPTDTDHASWTTADGASHALDHLVPATPKPPPAPSG